MSSLLLSVGRKCLLPLSCILIWKKSINVLRRKKKLYRHILLKWFSVTFDLTTLRSEAKSHIYYSMTSCYSKHILYGNHHMACMLTAVHGVQHTYLWCRVYYVGFHCSTYVVRRSTYDVRRRAYDIWHTTCDILCSVLSVHVNDVHHTCKQRMKYIQRIAKNWQPLSEPVFFWGGGGVTAFLVQRCHDWIMYYGNLNCMLYKLC
jgi:hypothetical protein